MKGLVSLIRIEGTFPTINALGGNIYQFDGMLAPARKITFTSSYRLLSITANLRIINEAAIWDAHSPIIWRTLVAFLGVDGHALSPFVESLGYTAITLTNDVPAMYFDKEHIIIHGFEFIGLTPIGKWDFLPAGPLDGLEEIIIEVEENVYSNE